MIIQWFTHIRLPFLKFVLRERDLVLEN